MRFIKNILGRVFAFWAAVVFILTLLFVLPPIWIIGMWKEPTKTIFLISITRVWMRVFFFLSGLRLKIKGIGNFKKGENYIIVYNHNSLMDVPVSTPFSPGGNKTIAKIEMARVPLFGVVYKRGSILVDRKNEESRKTSYLKMKEVLKSGLHMVIYPEGTRNKTTQPLQRFHDGAFRLSFDSGNAILPALIFNTAKVLPRKTFFFWPAKIELHYLEPVSPGKFTSPEKLKEYVFELMKDYYTSHSD